LGNVNNVVQRVRELVVEGGNDTQSQSARNDTAAEIDQLANALKQEANATYNGQYIFSGTSTNQPYAVGDADAYAGNSGVVTREIGPKTTVQINTDISQLLGSGQPDGKLLSVLRDISSDLRGGTTANADALRTTDLSNIDSNISTLQMLQANVGATENRLSLASSRIQDLQVSQTQELTTVQDADMAQTTIDYSTEQAAYTAALHASANIVQSSLLDFLK
jgi:flagellar hook-associated protein 3 FlgL